MPPTRPMPNIQGAPTNAAASVAAGITIGELQAPKVETIHGRQMLMRQNANGVYEPIDLSVYAPTPMALHQTIMLTTPDSFVDYVKMFGSKDNSLVLANEQAMRLQAVLDYHQSPTQPSWMKHHAILTLTKTKAWEEWNSFNKIEMDQSAFAQFIEDRVPDIAAPNGDVLAEMIRNFEEHRDVSFKSVKRAQNGTMSLTYTEQVKEGTADGAMKIPQSIVLKLLPFEGSENYLPENMSGYAVDARIRYRITSGRLVLWYELVRPTDVFKAAFANVVTSVRDQIKDFAREVVFGSLPAAG